MRRGSSNTPVKVGDTVKVLGTVENETCIRGLPYIRTMDKYIGCVSEITSIDYDYTDDSSPCVTLDIDGGWYWVPEWLDFDVEPIQCSLDDIDNAFGGV